MTVSRRLVLVAALHVIVGLVPAFAQTVIVQNAAPGSTAEFVLNGAVVASGTAGTDGLVTLIARQGAIADRASLDVFIWVDRCDSVHRVIVADRIATPPPAGGNCSRAPIAGLFLLQPVTTIVVNIERDPPTMRLRQGPAPREWLLPPSEAAAAAGLASIAPRGLILFGGGGRSFSSAFSSQACGDVSTCSSDDQVFAGEGGVAVWPSRYIGLEVSLLRPGRMTAEGSGDAFEFNSDMDGGLLLFAGKVGVPIGRVRPFGMGGMNFHRATFTTVQTINESSQTFQWRSEGWGHAFGGGVEVWLSSRVGIYGELTRLALKGDDVGGGEARTDAEMTSIVVGLRVRLFGE